MKNFTLDSASVAFNPPVGQKSAEEIAAVAGADDQQGCSAGTGAAGGMLFAAAGIVFALRRRRHYLR